MKKYLPYVFNVAIVFLGIIFPYFLFNNNSIYEDHEIIIFLLISFVFTIIINIFNEIKFKHWVYSSLIFYLTVLLIFLLGDQWGLNTVNIFTPFQIQHHSTKHYDPLPRLLEFNYPIAILLLSLINMLSQLMASKIVKIIKNKHD